MCVNMLGHLIIIRKIINSCILLYHSQIAQHILCLKILVIYTCKHNSQLKIKKS